MTDIHSSKIRSYHVSNQGKEYKTRNVSTEIPFFSKWFRYRINVKTMPGSPDIVSTNIR
jgi:G:T-mismatch repair DNA endonuclease (very short patch repair protein)